MGGSQFSLDDHNQFDGALGMTKINKCLNVELKYFGTNIWSITLSICFLVLGVMIKGGIAGCIAGVIGFVCGIFVSKWWHFGLIQEFLYQHLSFVNDKIPGS